jgi:hypothetical protein
MEATTLGSHMAVAKAGNAPWAEFMGRLENNTSARVRDVFGVRKVPGRLELT